MLELSPSVAAAARQVDVRFALREPRRVWSATESA